MSLIPGERLVVPLGKYELFFSSDVEIRYASSGFSVFEIPPMVLISDISTQSEGFIDEYGRVVLIGTQVINDLSFIVTGHKVSYQWYYAEGLSALPVPIVGQCSSNLTGGSELKSGVYRCVASTPYDDDIVSSWVNIFADPSVYELFPVEMGNVKYGYSAGYGSITPSVVPIFSDITNVYSDIKFLYIDSVSETIVFTIVDDLEFYAADGLPVTATFSGLDGVAEDLTWDVEVSHYSIDGLDNSVIDLFINAASSSSSILVTITPDINQGSKRPKPIKGESDSLTITPVLDDVTGE